MTTQRDPGRLGACENSLRITRVERELMHLVSGVSSSLLQVQEDLLEPGVPVGQREDRFVHDLDAERGRDGPSGGVGHAEVDARVVPGL